MTSSAVNFTTNRKRGNTSLRLETSQIYYNDVSGVIASSPDQFLIKPATILMM